MVYRQAQCKDRLLTGRRPELLHDALDMRKIDMFLPDDQPIQFHDADFTGPDAEGTLLIDRGGEELFAQRKQMVWQGGDRSIVCPAEFVRGDVLYVRVGFPPFFCQQGLTQRCPLLGLPSQKSRIIFERRSSLQIKHPLALLVAIGSIHLRRHEIIGDCVSSHVVYLQTDQPVLSAPDALKRHYHQDQNSTRKYRAIRLVAMSKSVRGPQNILALPVISGFSSMEGLSSSVSTVNVLPLVLSTLSSALVATDKTVPSKLVSGKARALSRTFCPGWTSAISFSDIEISALTVVNSCTVAIKSPFTT